MASCVTHGALGVIIHPARFAWQLRFAPIMTGPRGNVAESYHTESACLHEETHCQGTHYLDSGYMPAIEMKSRRNMLTTLTRQPSKVWSVSMPNVAFEGWWSKMKKSVAGKLGSRRLARIKALGTKATRYAVPWEARTATCARDPPRSVFHSMWHLSRIILVNLETVLVWNAAVEGGSTPLGIPIDQFFDKIAILNSVKKLVNHNRIM